MLPSLAAASVGRQAVKVCERSFLEGARLREEPKPEGRMALRAPGQRPWSNS